MDKKETRIRILKLIKERSSIDFFSEVLKQGILKSKSSVSEYRKELLKESLIKQDPITKLYELTTQGESYLDKETLGKNSDQAVHIDLPNLPLLTSTTAVFEATENPESMNQIMPLPVDVSAKIFGSREVGETFKVYEDLFLGYRFLPALGPKVPLQPVSTVEKEIAEDLVGSFARQFFNKLVIDRMRDLFSRGEPLTPESILNFKAGVALHFDGKTSPNQEQKIKDRLVGLLILRILGEPLIDVYDLDLLSKLLDDWGIMSENRFMEILQSEDSWNKLVITALKHLSRGGLLMDKPYLLYYIPELNSMVSDTGSLPATLQILGGLKKRASMPAGQIVNEASRRFNLRDEETLDQLYLLEEWGFIERIERERKEKERSIIAYKLALKDKKFPRNLYDEYNKIRPRFVQVRYRVSEDVYGNIKFSSADREPVKKRRAKPKKESTNQIERSIEIDEMFLQEKIERLTEEAKKLIETNLEVLNEYPNLRDSNIPILRRADYLKEIIGGMVCKDCMKRVTEERLQEDDLPMLWYLDGHFICTWCGRAYPMDESIIHSNNASYEFRGSS